MLGLVNATRGHPTCESEIGLTSRPDGSLTHYHFYQMLVLATIFQCLGPITTVVALLSSKPLFNSPMEKRDEATACV
jgi:hypothetical protein